MKTIKELMWKGEVLINVLEGGLGKTVFTGGKWDKSLTHPPHPPATRRCDRKHSCWIWIRPSGIKTVWWWTR